MTRVKTAAINGIEAREAEIVATPRAGAGLLIDGMPERAAAEMTWRIREALASVGCAEAADGMRLQLQPAREWGEHAWDLAAAVALLTAAGKASPPGETIVAAALQAKSRTGHVLGIVPIARFAAESGRALMLPSGQLGEAGAVRNSRVVPVGETADAVEWLNGPRKTVRPGPATNKRPVLDMADIDGQEAEKRALTIAAAGRHNVLLAGTPGSRAVALARRLPGLLGPMDETEHYASAAVHSVAGTADPLGGFGRARLLRAPHHTASAGAIGGTRSRNARPGRPGETSLAHAGVLLLDEMSEFEHAAIDAVAQAMRARRAPADADGAGFPAAFLLAATAIAEPPCGRRFDSEAEREEALATAIGRIRRPELFDIAIEVARPKPRGSGEHRAVQQSTAQMAAAVRRARQRLTPRNARPGPRGGERPTEHEAAERLAALSAELGSTEAERVRRIATTICGLREGPAAGAVASPDVEEAIALRKLIVNGQK